MAELYRCDNCEELIDHPHRQLHNNLTMPMNMVGNSMQSDSPDYHICEGCWEELGWDE